MLDDEEDLCDTSIADAATRPDTVPVQYQDRVLSRQPTGS